MEGYCVWLKEGAMQKLLDTAFQIEEFREKLRGVFTITTGLKPVNISWEVIQAPQVSFADIDPTRETLNENGGLLVISESMFTIVLTVRFASSEDYASELPIILIADPSINSGMVFSFLMVGLQMHDSYTEMERAIIKTLCPMIIAAINNALGFSAENAAGLYSMSFLNNLEIMPVIRSGILRKSGRLGTWVSNDFASFDPDPCTSMDESDIAVVMSDGIYEVLLSSWMKMYSDAWSFEKEYPHETILGEAKFWYKSRVSDIVCNCVNEAGAFGLGVVPDISLGVRFVKLGIEATIIAIFDPKAIQAFATLSIRDDIVTVCPGQIQPFDITLECDLPIIGGQIEDALEDFKASIAQTIINYFSNPIMIQLPAVDIPTGFAVLHAKLSNYKLFSAGSEQTFLTTLNVSVDQ